MHQQDQLFQVDAHVLPHLIPPVKEDPGIGPSNITKSLSSMSHPYAIVDLPIEPLTAPSSVSTDFIKLSCLDINEAT